ncbi:MAG: hypothetical protein IKN11_10505 [Bacteroidales bacterium]|nr:hypothetical protein [Bacteroidales bacterium]
MKRIVSAILFVAFFSTTQAQNTVDTSANNIIEGDTAMAAQIIDNYLSFLDFEPLLKDSMLHVVSWVLERNHTDDTMTIHRWYGPNDKTRIEMWQKGKMKDAFYSDGKVFRKFSSSRREWLDLSRHSYYDHVMSLDIRGALHKWRSKGAEAYYKGEYTYNNHPVYRVFVTSPDIFDRNYFFEKETGLLFIVKEENHIFGDIEPAENAILTDWRAWHEFIPFRGCLLPSIESYQVDDEIIIIYHNYSLEAYKEDAFSQNVFFK